MSKIVESQLSVYQEHFLKHGDTPEGTYNQNDVFQHLRFERLLKQLPEKGSRYSLHDVGCGICDLHEYIKKNKLPFIYSGTDIVPEMGALAKEKFPDITIKTRDILQCSSDEKYDFLCLAGTFNMPGESSPDKWLAFCNEMIEKMFSMCRYGISFNFLTGFADFYHPDMFYRDPRDVQKFCIEKLSRHVIVDHAYPLYEYTVTVFKEEYLQKQYPQKILKKYFKSKVI